MLFAFAPLACLDVRRTVSKAWIGMFPRRSLFVSHLFPINTSGEPGL